MEKRNLTVPFSILLILALLVSLTLPISQAAVITSFNQEESQPSSIASKNSTFKPAMWKPFWVDQNDNGISDTLDREIADRLQNNTAQEYVNAIVALRAKPTADDADAFISSEGYLTTSPWTNALYGFGGQIPYNQIASFVQSDANVLMVEKEQISHAQIAYAAKQIGARSYVWNTLGLQGDPQTSLAIVDTGIDDSHSDFSPGYGDLNFTRKIVGWNDQITPSTTSPYDDNGHGSHVSGLAAGNGFFSTDGSGNAVATWGANLGSLSTGTYLISGMMVNKTGTITVNVKWKNIGTGKLTALRLYYGDKTINSGSWTQVGSVTTPTKGTWYTLTYSVASTPTGGYDMYHILMSFTAGLLDNFYAVFTISWPYTPPSDGFPAWTGIAPQTRLVGVKVLDYTGSGTDTGFLNAVDWIIANRQTYHIVIASMSLGFGAEVAAADIAVKNLVDSGITTVVSAGNDGSGGNNIFTPGSVDEIITVAALNQFDSITSYSSQGGTSGYTGNTVKPDIAAPGGSFYAVPLFSSDSNDWDADKGWLDVVSNDSAPMQGTSMSAPIVSGAASIVIQAMGGFANWQYTREQALMPKMVLLMTATETYPNLREPSSTAAPTLERGGKDAHEGYGRLNLDAAFDAILKTYDVGAVVTETLGRPPTISDISVLGQKLAWARKVELTTVGRYNFTLTVPSGADFDLYLYNSTGTHYGEPAIVAKSTNATTGGLEQITLTAPYNGTYYLAVKRATANTGSGTFTLESTYTPPHDVAVTRVEPSAASVYQGGEINITVTVKNKGLNTETFGVTAFYNTIITGTQTISNLAPSATATLSFTWNTSGLAVGYYTIKAQADTVPNEYNSLNNVLIYGTVQVKIPGDVDGDRAVNIVDYGGISAHWYPGPPIGPLGYAANSDINGDGNVDIADVSIVSAHWTGPPEGPLAP